MGIKKKKTSAPAMGDRIDLSGKVPQFKSFALYVYRELVNDNIEWIRIADPAALKLDDIQFATATEIKAYQVKWSRKKKPTPFPFSEFAKLLPHLCEAYQSLKREHKSLPQKLKTHLLTNRPFSKSDSIKNGSGNSVGSFDDFFSKVWYFLKAGKQNQIERKWAFIVQRLQKTSGLSVRGFKEFVENFDIVTDDLNQLEQSPRYEDRQLIEDTNKLFLFLLNQVQEIDGKVEFQAKDITAQLNWTSRTTTTFSHDFIVDATTYQPIRATVTELNTKLKAIQSGYLYLIGAPGSGKSSLLTTWLKGRAERIIQYYAFTNLAASENRPTRGESENLFFDLVQQLREKRAGEQKNLPYKEDADAIQRAFYEQLQALHFEYKKDGLKTIILIDGLDHLPREYRPRKSFLTDLPSPNAIPEGVVIVLGSQTYELEELNPNVRTSMTDDRLIRIKPLTRLAIGKLIDSYKLSVKLNAEEKKSVAEISQGHPLYLTYILKYLSDKIGTKSIPDLLQDLPEYEGDIENYYKKFWIGLQNSIALTEVLALLSRIKGPALPTFIGEWSVNQQTLMELRSKAIHFFDISDSGWAIFHNSFRQFLIRQTALNILSGIFDVAKHQEFHLRLAHFYQESKIEPDWNCLHHLYEGGDFDEFLRVGTPEFFTNQLLNFRPFHRIEQDIIIAIQIAKAKDDPQILVRYLLSLLELQTRDKYVRAASFCKQFIQMGKIGTAFQHLVESGLLLVNESFALDTAFTLYHSGHVHEANMVYALSIPNEVQERGIKLIDRNLMNRRQEVLRKWMVIGILLEPLTLMQVRLQHITEKTEKGELKEHLLSRERVKRLLSMDAATMLIASGREKDFEAMLKQLPLKDVKNTHYWFSAMRFAVEQLDHFNEHNKAKLFLKSLITESRKLKLSNDERIYLANIAFKVTKDKKLLSSLLEEVGGPDLVKPDEIEHDGDIDIFYPLFLYQKLTWIIGKGKSASEAIPATTQPNEQSLVDFKRMICRIAQINAASYSAHKQTETLVKNEVRPLLHFFYRTDKNPTYRDLYWYRISKMIPGYLRMIVDSVSRYGPPYIEMLQKLLDGEIENFSSYWSADSRRAFLLSLFNNGVSKTWINPRLDEVEKIMLADRDITQRVEQCIMQADAYIHIEENQEALRLLRSTLSQSFGVGYRKDFQLEIWIEWLTKVNLIEESKATERIGWLASRLYLIKQTSERSTAYDAGISLLQCTLDWNIAAGVPVFYWMLDKELIPFDRGIRRIMTALIQKSGKEDFSDLSKFCTTFLFRFLDGYSHDLIRSLINKANEVFSQKEMKTFLQHLIQAIKIHVSPDSRSEFILDVMDCVKEIGIDSASIPNWPVSTALKRKDQVHASELIIRKNGTTESLSKEEVVKEIKSFDDFSALLKQEDGWNSSFRWENVIDGIPGLQLSDLQNFYNTEVNSRKKSSLYAKFSQVAFGFGDKQLAQGFAKKALEMSSDYGWSVSYDGGTRLQSFRAMIDTETYQARKMAFDYLVQDSITYSDITSLLPHLDEILPVISTNFSVEKTWEEIEWYLKKLFVHVEPLPGFPDLSDKKSSVRELLDNLLTYLLESPIDIIAVNTRNFIATEYGQK